MTPWTPPVFNPSLGIRDQQTSAQWSDAVATIVARHGLKGGPMAPFESGSDIVWGNEVCVVKLTTPKWAEQMAREQTALGTLTGRLSIASPEVIASGDIGGWPYFVMTTVTGLPLGAVWDRAASAERLRLARALGAVTAELHAIDVPPAHDTPDDWAAFIAKWRANVGKRHIAKLAPENVRVFGAPIEAFVEAHWCPTNADAETSSEHLVWLHTELLGEHILVDEATGQLCGIIDVADARLGAKEYDFVAPCEFVFRGEPGAVTAFFEGYGADQPTPQSLLAWALCHQFGSISRALAAAGTSQVSSLDDLAMRLYR